MNSESATVFVNLGTSGNLDNAVRTVQNVGVEEALLTAVFALVGLAIGSFLNVCIDRLPSGRSIISPPSQCDQCQRRLSPVDLVPVFSYLWLRGRCRYCRALLPKRLVLVELTTGVMLGALYLVYGLSPEFGVSAFWGCLSVVIFVIDLEHGLILNRVVYPSIGVALLFAGFLDLSWLEGWGVMEEWPPIAVAGLGGGVGFLFFFLLAVFAIVVLRREGMGWGDVKLAALIGLACGFPLLVVVMVLGAVIGLFMALLMGRAKGGQTIPFGSALVVATMIAILAGQNMVDWLAGLY